MAGLNKRADPGAVPSCLALGPEVIKADNGLERESLMEEVAGGWALHGLVYMSRVYYLPSYLLSL